MISLSLAAVVLTLLSGALVGLLLAVFGGGGSVLAAPLLLYLVGVKDPHIAIGTSSAAVAANALLNLVGHSREGRVKWPCAITFALAGLIGSFAGSTLAKSIGGPQLLLAFAAAMAAIALSMMRPTKSAGNPDVHITPSLMLRLTPLGLIVGFAAGFFGIGGGFLIVPGLMLATGMTMANATASSLVSVGIFGTSTALNYASSNQVDWRLAGLLLAGGVLGSLVGIGAARKLASNASQSRRLFAGFILLVAGYVGFRAWASL
jgi:uncharacterized membrane protein YfcA